MAQTEDDGPRLISVAIIAKNKLIQTRNIKHLQHVRQCSVEFVSAAEAYDQF